MKEFVRDCLVLGGAAGIVRGVWLVGGDAAAWIVGGSFLFGLGLASGLAARTAGPR